MKPPNAGKGRVKGVPNKATKDVREAIAKLLGSNTENFSVWLAGVAEGEKEFEPELDDSGNPVIGDDGEPKGTWEWLRRPNPEGALKLALDMAEFHIPKLARTEHVGGDGGPVQVKATIEFVNAPSTAPEQT